ncbi:MAG: DUF6655 family protein [Brevundimonas sp.]|uniref:DUF6655 family protein n=1 Tax=Brevundimonas sp. TaxID=1871086 RepID=UPI00391D57DB
MTRTVLPSRTAPILSALLAAVLAAACASTSETNPSRTATEQLLVARAADRAVENLTLPVPDGSVVFVDETYFRAEASPYAISAIREALSQAGYALARNRDQADVIFEIRAGALSLEQMRRLLGIPAMSVPLSDYRVVSFPELSLYSRRDRSGVAEFSGFVYRAGDGAPIAAVAPMIGQYTIRSHRLLMMMTWGQQFAEPGEQDPGESWWEF